MLRIYPILVMVMFHSCEMPILAKCTRHFVTFVAPILIAVSYMYFVVPSTTPVMLSMIQSC